jgi:molybdopterin-guanine dinucleotide biosynthesis protein A
MRPKPLDAIVLAGGRIDGEYAAAAGTEVKALVAVAGRASGARVVEALQGAEWVGRVAVVGPESVRASLPEGCEWVPETDSAYGNVRAGLDLLQPEDGAQVLLCGADVPALTPAAVDDFILRSPTEADFCLPVVRRERYLEVFPGSSNLYVRLAEGRFTGGREPVRGFAARGSGERADPAGAG